MRCCGTKPSSCQLKPSTHQTGDRIELPQGATPEGGSRRRRVLRCMRSIAGRLRFQPSRPAPSLPHQVPNEHAENAGTRKRRHPEEGPALDPLENAIRRIRDVASNVSNAQIPVISPRLGGRANRPEKRRRWKPPIMGAEFGSGVSLSWGLSAPPARSTTSAIRSSQRCGCGSQIAVRFVVQITLRAGDREEVADLRPHHTGLERRARDADWPEGGWLSRLIHVAARDQPTQRRVAGTKNRRQRRRCGDVRKGGMRMSANETRSPFADACS